MTMFSPYSIVQTSAYPDQEVSWESVPSPDLTSILGYKWKGIRELSHIANTATGDLRTSTYTLTCTDFKFVGLPPVISGIHLTLSVQRSGRIVDQVIQITHGGVAIGDNRTSHFTDYDGNLIIMNNSVVGGISDMWGAVLTPEVISDPSFGVILQFQSHPSYPHSSAVTLDYVGLTVF